MVFFLASVEFPSKLKILFYLLKCIKACKSASLLAILYYFDVWAGTFLSLCLEIDEQEYSEFS